MYPHETHASGQNVVGFVLRRVPHAAVQAPKGTLWLSEAMKDSFGTL